MELKIPLDLKWYKLDEMTVSIIGSGNIAWHLVNIFEENGIRVAELFARKRKNAEYITGYLYDVVVKSDLDFRNSPSTFFIMAVTDDAIVQVAKDILLPEKAILVHTSGAKGMIELLAAMESNPTIKLGVFYPLMTFTRGVKVEFRNVPICIEAEDVATIKVLKDLGFILSKTVKEINSYQRSILHVAAVFACNFTNHLWALSKEIVDEEELDFEILKPLIKETFTKAMKSKHPAEVQTGPAVRDDIETIQKQRKLIQEDEDLLEVYNTLTKSIQDWYQ